ncbi:MAG: 5'/3'-nucleotidase SurE, partial [Acidimicrobiia bacterium]|nr:5'/3'-nucleotidase SurE [Acidimicrobiia bacterium]
MRVLVTNDDGVFAPGIAALALAVASEGHDVVIAAPSGECSGAGAALGPLHLTGKIAYSAETLAGLEQFPVRAVDGPPALAVLSACLGGFGEPPDAVVSGINAGGNTGRAVLHSGTVGAALTAANFGRPAMAVSLALGSPAHWETAAATAAALLPWLDQLEPPSVLNVNVPNVPRSEVRAVCAAGLADAGTVQAAVIEESDSETLELTLPSPRPVGVGTDSHAVAEGYVVLTVLSGLRATPTVLDAPIALI